MTDPSNKTPAAARGVLDPAWEDELRSGQEAEGEAGSVDAELAFVHLLRHARAPEALESAQLDAIWADIDLAITPEPWWRKAWVWWTAPAVAAAAVAFVVVVQPGAEEASLARNADEIEQQEAALEQATPAPASTATPEVEERAAAEAAPKAEADAEAEDAGALALGPGGGASGSVRNSQGSVAETYFKQLAPNGRRALRVSVDQGRDQLRGQLLASARKGG